MTIAPVPGEMRVTAFPHDVFDCCDDGQTCRMAFFCPYCAHFVLCHEIKDDGDYRNCIVWLLSCIALQPMVQSTCFYGGPVAVVLDTIDRTRLREKYGLAGDELSLIHI